VKKLFALAVLLVVSVNALAGICWTGKSINGHIENKSNSLWEVKVLDTGYGNVWFDSIGQMNGSYSLKPLEKVKVTYTSTKCKIEGDIELRDKNRVLKEIAYIGEDNCEGTEHNTCYAISFTTKDKSDISKTVKFERRGNIIIQANSF
jgi:hypothetical protein